jgi:peptidoglycan-associated lipoprotein
MKKNVWTLLALFLILPAMMLSVSCAKKAVDAEPAVTTAPDKPEPMEAKPEPKPEPEPEKPMVDQAALDAVAAKEAAMAARNKFINEAVYFDFDSSAILPAAQQVIADKVDYMMANADVKVSIEGHCDERGTNAYNMALGQRRADAVRDFMINLGVYGDRLTTISYGEERPVDYGSNEEAWAKNRRAQLSLD